MDPYYHLIAGGVVLAGLAAVGAVVSLRKCRHVFRVPQGWAGLLYRDGIYVRRNNAGPHVVWGLGWTIRLMDLRKASRHPAVQVKDLKFSAELEHRLPDALIKKHQEPAALEPACG